MLAARSAAIAIGFSLSAAIAATSCGGSVQVDTGSAGRAGAGDAGTSGSGGAGGSGGASGSAGSGELPARCLLPRQDESCNRAVIRYMHDRRTGICEAILGCSGGENNFETLEACQAACRGGHVEMDACTSSAECTFASPFCCDACDPGEKYMFVAINERYSAEYEKMKGCHVTCGTCPAVDELRTRRQYFVPACRAGQCAVVDIRETPVIDCTGDDDCRLRDSAGCCDECDGSGLVSVRPELNRELTCDGTEACPPCAGMIPPEYAPRCIGGRCAVTRATP